jgi:hypothetical protein
VGTTAGDYRDGAGADHPAILGLDLGSRLSPLADSPMRSQACPLSDSGQPGERIHGLASGSCAHPAGRPRWAGIGLIGLNRANSLDLGPVRTAGQALRAKGGPDDFFSSPGFLHP